MTLGEVKTGDILLSYGDNLLSETIRLLDGGYYSHSAICAGIDENNGPMAIEATKKGVVKNSLSDDMEVQLYVDVYRFEADTGHTFESPGWPSDPVIDRAAFYEAAEAKYAHSQLLLMGILVLVRKAPLGVLPNATLRSWLDRFINTFKDSSASDIENVTCSELVYRCFYEAESDPRWKYGLGISGTLNPDGVVIRTFARHAIPDVGKMDQQTRGLYQEAQKILDKMKPSLHRNLKGIPESGDDIVTRAANPYVCADMVTPHDLQKSPNLNLIGRLQS